MTEVGKELASLLEEQFQLKEQFNYRHDKISHYLPVELVSRVLRLCLPPEPTLDNFTKAWRELHTSKPFHFTLGAVCKAWRELLWKDPCMWNVIDLVVSVRRPLALGTGDIVRWLNRSGPLPLFVRIGLEEGEWKSLRAVQKDLALRFITSIVQTLQFKGVMSRLKILSLKAPFSCISKLRCDLFGSTNLKGLYLDASPWNGDPGYRGGTIACGATPPLQRVSITALSLTEHSFTWSNIICFTANHFTHNECIEILQHAPRLTRFETNKGWSKSRSASPKAITHAYLEVFHVFSSRVDFWDYVTFPKLQELVVSNLLPVGLVKFIVRSGCSLKGARGERELLQILESSPSLRALSLTHAGRKEFLKRLMETTGVDSHESCSGVSS